MAYFGEVGLRMSRDVRELRHLCGIFWLGWFMDVRRYEGVAPSMWHILVRLVYGCREI